MSTFEITLPPFCVDVFYGWPLSIAEALQYRQHAILTHGRKWGGNGERWGRESMEYKAMEREEEREETWGEEREQKMKS